MTLLALAVMAGDGGDHARAAALYRESLDASPEEGAKENLVDGLAGMATVAVGGGLATEAARLLGTVEAQREALGYAFELPERERYGRAAEAAREALGEEAFAAAWAAGRALPLEEAAAEALALADALAGGVPKPVAS